MDIVYYFERWVWKGQDVVTRVYREAECYTAESALDILDKVVTDGRSADEVLRAHLRVLPVALLAREALCLES